MKLKGQVAVITAGPGIGLEIARGLRRKARTAFYAMSMPRS